MALVAAKTRSDRVQSRPSFHKRFKFLGRSSHAATTVLSPVISQTRPTVNNVISVTYQKYNFTLNVAELSL